MQLDATYLMVLSAVTDGPHASAVSLSPLRLSPGKVTLSRMNPSADVRTISCPSIATATIRREYSPGASGSPVLSE